MGPPPHGPCNDAPVDDTPWVVAPAQQQMALRTAGDEDDVEVEEFEGKIKVFKLNTDENPNVASQYGIRSIPTLMVFKGGQKVDTVVGAVPKATLSGTISKHL